MYVEVPVLQKCCFCIPLRGSLMEWAYLRLITMALILCHILWSIIGMIRYPIYLHQKCFEDFAPVVSIMLLVIADICLHAIFVIGGHKNNVKLLKVYYRYNIAIFVLTTLLIVGMVIAYRLYYVRLDNEFYAVLINLFIQGYLLVLFRSEIDKLNKGESFGTLNKLAEAEKCYFKVDNMFKQKEVANYGIVQEKERVISLSNSTRQI